MTEETTPTLIDVEKHTGRALPLSFYSSVVGSVETANYKLLRSEIQGKLDRGEPVYVKFHDDRRRDSVGRIKSITMPLNTVQRRDYWRHNTVDYVNGGFDDIEIVWDGRKNKVKPYCSEIMYLPDWTGGTQWYWEQTVKPKVDPVIAYDHLGQELEVGQNVCFVHRRYGTTSMMFGTVTRFTPKGSVYVKVMKLKDNQYLAGQELKALTMDDVVIVNDTLMKRLVMAKLAAN